MSDTGTGEFVDLVARRAEFLKLLADGPLAKRDIVDRLDASRSTTNRAITSLEDAGLVERTGEGYATTAAGRIALERHRKYVAGAVDVADAADVLASLSADCELDASAVTGGDAFLAAEPAPYRPVEQLHETVAGADRYRAVLPALDEARHVRLVFEHVVTDGQPAELVVSEELLGSLRAEFPRRLASMADTGSFDLRVGDTPSFAVVLTESDGGTTVSVVVFSEGSVRGVLQNRSESAVAWAESLYADYRADAADAVDRVSQGERDGGCGEADGTDALERAGFLELSSSYFADRATADPVTAWRAGLDLAEVQTGYAVDRTDDDGDVLTDAVLELLADGSDVAVVGPPGCGKSTTCKQVACEWYRDGRGVVFYRERGRGRAFHDPDALVSAVENADGRALVVVEDAVRPGARAVFDAMLALDDREDVAFLVDARESEWHDPPGSPLASAVESFRATRVETVTMPPLLGRDCARLVEHVERTVEDSADIPLDRLREEISQRSRAAAEPGDVLFLLHRAALYADPLADDTTTFEEDVRRVYDQLADEGDTALDAGVLVNVMNVAGLPVTPRAVHAIDAPTATVDAALDRLEGRVVFPDPDRDQYRTIHETWSMEFLAHVLDAEGADSAAERTARVLTGLFALAGDDASAVAGSDGDRAALAEHVSGTSDEADATIERVFAALCERPKLAPLLGRSDGPTPEFPDGCSMETSIRVLRHRAGAYTNNNDLDAADAELDEAGTLLDRADGLDESAADVLRGRLLRERGRIAFRRGDVDAANDCFERARDQFRAAGEPNQVAACFESLAALAGARDDYPKQAEYAERGLAYDDLEGRIEANLLNLLGQAHWGQGDLDAAREYLAESRDFAREVGHRVTEGRALSNLGLVARERGAFDDAVEHFTQGIDVYRELGARGDEALDLWNLGEVARRRGAFEDAEQYIEEARELYRVLDDEMGVALCEVVLGRIALARGDTETAEGHGRRSLAVFRDHENPLDQANALLLLAGVQRERGSLDDAETNVREAGDRCAEIDSAQGELWCDLERGRIARARGDYDAAVQHLEAALGRAREEGFRYDEATALEELARVAVERGDRETARDQFDAALRCHDACGSPHRVVDVIEELVDVCVAAGDHEAAAEYCERGVEAAEHAGLTSDARGFRERRERFVVESGPDRG